MRFTLRPTIKFLPLALSVAVLGTGCHATRQSLSGLPGLSWVAPSDELDFEEYADDDTDLTPPSETVKPKSITSAASDDDATEKSYADTGLPSPYDVAKSAKKYATGKYDETVSNTQSQVDRYASDSVQKYEAEANRLADEYKSTVDSYRDDLNSTSDSVAGRASDYADAATDYAGDRYAESRNAVDSYADHANSYANTASNYADSAQDAVESYAANPASTAYQDDYTDKYAQYSDTGTQTEYQDTATAGDQYSNPIQDTVDSYADTARDTIGEYSDRMRDTVDSYGDVAVDAAQDYATSAVDTATNAVQPYADQAQDAYDQYTETATDTYEAVQDAGVNAAEEMADRYGAATHEAGNFVDRGVGALAKGQKTIHSAATNLTNRASQSFGTARNSIAETAKGAYGAVAEKATEAYGYVADRRMPSDRTTTADSISDDTATESSAYTSQPNIRRTAPWRPGSTATYPRD
ncbi:MAG: hypothetical protein KDB27_31815 [Planctomycetales bacterium]|nr:hypothetical protein [Planctomycetales bacterium]